MPAVAVICYIGLGDRPLEPVLFAGSISAVAVICHIGLGDPTSDPVLLLPHKEYA